ncbi:MAG: hypothetical protein AAF560_19825 [Acidobacteriota bacterium]
MDNSSRLFASLVIIIGLAAGVVLFRPVVEEQLAPELTTAWVAIEVAGSEIADVGTFELEAGDTFRLRAVLEARDRQGEPVYYTEASRLSFGGEEVPAERLRIWDRLQPVKVRWFTVEGQRPFKTLEAESGLDDFTFQEFLRHDWPMSWTIPGEIDAAHDNHLENDSAEKVQRFGTQRYHVRIELYRNEDSLIPERVIRSWGVADLKQQIAAFPTVRLTLPGALSPASSVFGLTQLELYPDAERQVIDGVAELADNHIAFSRLTVLRDQIAPTGKAFAELPWTAIELTGEARWGEQAAAGDLLRVGDRVVVLYDDRGIRDVVDYDDLCFDFSQGASVRALGDIFVGSGNTVELASLQSS